MNVRAYFPAKDPADQLDYEIDFSAWMAAGDTITNASLQSVPAGLVLDAPAINAGKVRFWASGGTAAKTYRVSCTVVTTQGRTANRSVILPVTDR